MPTIKIIEENYPRYKSFFELVWQNYSKLVPELLAENDPDSPIQIMKRAEQKSQSFARKCLQASLGDLVFMLQEAPPDFIANLEKQLSTQGLISFSSFKAIVFDTERKALKRGKIRTLDEYYIIKERESDFTCEITQSERSNLAQLMSDFETRNQHGV